MFRKACALAALLLAVAGSASAADVTRKLTNHHNVTTKGTKDGRAKGKQVILCLGNPLAFTLSQLTSTLGGDAFTANAFGAVYNCNDVTDVTPTPANAAPLGVVAFTCSWADNAAELAPCTGMLTLNSEWHKTTDLSTAAFSVWLDTDNLATGDFQLPPVAGVVTGTNGAWPKPENFQRFTWAQLNNGRIQITIDYKSRGWNPAA